jgi:hypothetical protein
MSDFFLKAGDTKPSISATLTVGGAPVGDLTGAAVRFRLREQASGVLKVDAPAVIVNPATCAVRYDWLAGDTDTPGRYLAEWGVVYSDGSEQTVPNANFERVRIGRRLP